MSPLRSHCVLKQEGNPNDPQQSETPPECESRTLMIPKTKRTKGAHGPRAVNPNACKAEQAEDAKKTDGPAWVT